MLGGPTGYPDFCVAFVQVDCSCLPDNILQIVAFSTPALSHQTNGIHHASWPARSIGPVQVEIPPLLPGRTEPATCNFTGLPVVQSQLTVPPLLIPRPARG